MFKNVLVSGKAGSGKDTVGDWLIANYDYRRVSFATPLKRIARELWPHLDWTQKNRTYLQELGMKVRDIDIDTWVRLGWLEAQRVNEMGHPVVITDCRYPNELDYFTARGFEAVRLEASYTVRVERLRARDGQVDEEALKHISETALDGTPMTVVRNDQGAELLWATLREVLGLPNE